MNEFADLEAELMQLRPVAVSADLYARVEHSLGETVVVVTAGILPRTARSRVNWLALGLGTAAAAVFLLLARTNVERPTAKPPTVTAATPTYARHLLPESLTRVVYQRNDEGLVFSPNESAPARRVRSHSRETLQWKDPRTGASLRVTYPTEEVELIPAPGQ